MRIYNRGALCGLLSSGWTMFWRGNVRGAEQFSNSSSPMANLIKELVNEIAWLRNENEELKRREKYRVITEKRCYRCGRKGHLERACCSYDTNINGNWRTSSVSALNTEANVACDEEDEGFHGSPSCGASAVPLIVETCNELVPHERDIRASAGLSEQSDARSIEDSEAEDEDGCNDSQPYSDGSTGEEEDASDADESESASEEGATGREEGEFDDAESDDEQPVKPAAHRPLNTTVELLGKLGEILEANPKVTEMLSLTGQFFESALGSSPG